MEVKTATQDGIAILTPVGRIDTSTAKTFEDAVMAAAAQNSKIAIKFNEIEYISSAGLRVVLMLGKKMSSSNGVLALTDMPEKIFAVFQMSGFNKILKIFNFQGSPRS